MSLIVAKTGVMLGPDGLYFQPGLGGEGLTILSEEFDVVRFGGSGSLSANAVIVASAGALFRGSGSLSAQNT